MPGMVGCMPSWFRTGISRPTIPRLVGGSVAMPGLHPRAGLSGSGSIPMSTPGTSLPKEAPRDQFDWSTHRR